MLQFINGNFLFVAVVDVLVDVEANVAFVRRFGDEEEDEQQLKAKAGIEDVEKVVPT